MNKKIVLYLIHIPVWAVAFFVSYFFSSDDVPPDNPTYVLFCTLTSVFWFLGSFYSFYSYLVPKYLEKRRVKTFWLYSILFVLIIMPVVVLSLAQITGIAALNLNDTFTLAGLLQWAGSVMGTLFCGGLGSVYRFSIDWFNNLHVRQDIKNIKLQSELNAIKSKLNPHFLFNSLNNIDTLIQTNSEKASTALSKLSDILRYVVYETENEMIPIQKEINNILKYIDLEKMRLSYPDSVSFSSSVTGEILIPPMIFLPFIENGFKHSNLNNPNHHLTISISENNDELSFHCSNTINDKKKDLEKTGVGVELAKKRLNLLFPNRHILDIEQQDNEYKVTLKINLIND